LADILIDTFTNGGNIEYFSAVRFAELYKQNRRNKGDKVNGILLLVEIMTKDFI
jgi:hypothetical protein